MIDVCGRVRWCGALLVGVLLLVLNIGCSSTSSPSQGEDFYPGGSIEDDPYYQSGLRLVWRAYPSVGDRQSPLFMHVLGSVIAFQDTGNTLSLIEDATGRVRWDASLGRPLEKFVGAARLGDTLLATSESEIQFLDIQNGQLIDRQRLSVLANTSPIIVPPIAVLGSATGEVFGHDLRVGVRVWGVALDGPIEAPVIDVGLGEVAAVSAGGEVVILSVRDGTSGGRLTRLFGGIDNRPVTDGEQLYLAGVDQSVWSFNLRSGDRNWRHRTESSMSAQPLVAEGVVVVDAEREGVIGLDAQSGEELWRQGEASGDAVASHRGFAYLWDGSVLRVLSLRDGSMRSEHTLPGIRWIMPGQAGVIYAVDVNGVVSKYEPLS